MATVLSDGGDEFRVVVTNGGGSITSTSALLTVTQQTSAARCATQVLQPGTTILMTSVSSSNPALLETFVGSANGNKVFHGVSVPEVEVQLSDNLSTFTIDAKAYASLNVNTGLVTNIGTLTETNTTIPQPNMGSEIIDSVTDAVYSPIFVDQRYTLTAGQSITQNWAQNTSTTVRTTTDGVPDTPITSTAAVSETVTTTFVGGERVTVPAGTFDTCKFIDTFSDGQTSTTTTHWILLDYGIDIMSISGSGTVSAKTISVNGVPL